MVFDSKSLVDYYSPFYVFRTTTTGSKSWYRIWRCVFAPRRIKRFLLGIMKKRWWRVKVARLNNRTRKEELRSLYSKYFTTSDLMELNEFWMVSTRDGRIRGVSPVYEKHAEMAFRALNKWAY